MPMRLAIMQPYFIPYAGYFRLFYQSDLFVIFDCVQFTRRGWIHRNLLPNSQGRLKWLTLPLKKSPQETAINALNFADDSIESWPARLHLFPQLHVNNHDNPLLNQVHHLGKNPLDFIVSTLKLTCEMLKLPFQVIYSSSLDLPTTCKGEDRIIAIAKKLGAQTYVNPPGGKELYDSQKFARQGLKLQFLSHYNGPYESILQRMITESACDVRKEIIKESQLID